MNLKSLFGKKAAVIGDPEALRDRLFEAVARNDLGNLAALCRANRDAIQRSYPVWLKPDPDFIGSDPRRVDWYGRSLLGRWGRELQESAELMRAHQYEDALTRLSDLRSRIRSHLGFEAMKWEGL